MRVICYCNEIYYYKVSRFSCHPIFGSVHYPLRTSPPFLDIELCLVMLHSKHLLKIGLVYRFGLQQSNKRHNSLLFCAFELIAVKFIAVNWWGIGAPSNVHTMSFFTHIYKLNFCKEICKNADIKKYGS